MTAPFIILALPRSRTAWLAHFLTQQDGRCGHDIAIGCKSVDDFIGCFGRDVWGTVETGAQDAIILARARIPNLRVIVVRRSVDQVMASFDRLGINVEQEEIERRAASLDRASEMLGVHTIKYETLARGDCCEWLFEHCLQRPFDLAWWQRVAALNIQIDVRRQIERVAQAADDIARLKREVSEQIAMLEAAQ